MIAKLAVAFTIAVVFFLIGTTVCGCEAATPPVRHSVGPDDGLVRDVFASDRSGPVRSIGRAR